MQAGRRGVRRRGGGVEEEEDEEDRNIRTLSHYTMATISISSSSRMTPPQTVCRHEHKLET